MNLNLTRKHWVIILVTPLALLLDQLSKLIIHASLKPLNEIVLIPRYLELILVKNRGLVFGMLSGRLGGFSTWIFLGITIIALAIIIHLFFRTESKAVLLPLALSLVLSGALGNLIDRFHWGYVVDFINMHYRGHYWPTFNVADIAITFGIIFLIIDSFRPPPKTGSQEKKEAEKKLEG